MRRIFWSGAAALLALAATGVAVANEGESRSTKAVSATFTAELGDSAVRTCLGSDGRYRRISGVWEGESQSVEASLDGELTVKGTAWIHVPTGNGSFEGRLRIGGEDGTAASIHGVIQGGKLEGLATGRAGKHELRLLANVSAAFSADALTDGKLGGGGGANSAILVKGSCPAKAGGDARQKEEAKKTEENHKKESEKAERKTREAEGTIAAFGEGSISVARDGAEPLTCHVGERMAHELAAAGYAIGTKVYAACVDEGRGFVLVKIKKL